MLHRHQFGINNELRLIYSPTLGTILYYNATLDRSHPNPSSDRFSIPSVGEASLLENRPSNFANSSKCAIAIQDS
jgi:hypothetical protein